MLDKKKYGIWLFVVLGMCGLIMKNTLAVDSTAGIPAIHDGARSFEDEGPIMDVDHDDQRIIMKEIRCVVGQFVLNQKVHTTRLVDAKGKKIALDSFEKGQWVIVRGYRVAKSKIYLSEVRTVDGTIRKERRTVKSVKTIEIK